MTRLQRGSGRVIVKHRQTTAYQIGVTNSRWKQTLNGTSRRTLLVIFSMDWLNGKFTGKPHI